jgi:hypothetical protein
MATVSRSVRSAYSTKAVVDWLALEIETARPTQFRWLQSTLADHFGDGTRTYIRTVDRDAGGAATRFLIRLNDAHCKDVDTIRAALAVLDRQYGLVSPVIIRGLEVSLDFYPNNDQARADILPLVTRLQASLEATGGTAHRLVGPSKWPAFLDGTSKPDPHKTFYVNHKRAPVSWRVYHKIRDRNQDLPHDQHRARVEFTLKGDGLHKYGIITLDDLAALDFRNFGELLHFRQFKPMSTVIVGKPPALAHMLQHATRRHRNMISPYLFGLHSYYRDSRTGQPRNGGRPKLRAHSTHTAADAELNRLVHDRLYDLNQTFHTKFSAKTDV